MDLAAAGVRIALGLQYDGAPFTGWQTQPDRRSIQDALEASLLSFVGEPTRVVCAGRTDAGVHATGQVVHFDCGVQRDEGAWVRGLNRYLPRSVAIRWARPVTPQFHARYCALSRSYEYWIVNDAVRSPLHAQRAAWVYRPLDERAMSEAARLLLGTHDFSSFRSAQCQARSPVRDLRVLDVSREGALLRIRAQANAFLHHMVRNLVGALVWVGAGRRPPSWVEQVLAARDRAAGAPTFAACGLYLTGVEYDPSFALPETPHTLLTWSSRVAPASSFAA
jgi:tRNA pseudouridine38-40 synthase